MSKIKIKTKPCNVRFGKHAVFALERKGWSCPEWLNKVIIISAFILVTIAAAILLELFYFRSPIVYQYREFDTGGEVEVVKVKVWSDEAGKHKEVDHPDRWMENHPDTNYRIVRVDPRANW